MSRRRKRRFWKAVLRPGPGRTLPRELRADAVGSLAGGFPAGVRDPGFATLLRRIDQAPLFDGNHVDAYFAGARAFDAMRAAIGAARSEILVESYIWKDDATGRDFRDLLGLASGRGVAVRILADALGSFSTRRSFWRDTRRMGIDVRLFHPLFPHLLGQPFRDHRKILVVDRRVVFSGGMNIADEYGGGSAASRGGPWRDTHARVEGPAAWEMAVVFEEAWRHAGGDSLDVEPLEPPAGSGARVLVLDSRPGRGHGETASVLSAIAAAARQRLWITNAYFAPTPRAVRALAAATYRGVDVRLLLPGPTDVPVVRHAGHATFDTLRRAGVRIFEYRSAILHAKTAVADGFVSVVGSSNLDFRSFHFNAECNFVILDETVAEAFEAAFEGDLACSAEIDARWSRSFPHRLGDTLALCLGPLL